MNSAPRFRFARSRSASSGTTVLELLVVLALAGVLLGMVVPLGRGTMDRLHVVAAREELFGLVYRARGLATHAGGATIRVELEGGRATLWSAQGAELDRVDLGPRGVGISTTGSAEVIDVVWNALGWGVVASRTLVLRKGGAEARLVISSRGRASRR